MRRGRFTVSPLVALAFGGLCWAIIVALALGLGFLLAHSPL